MISAVYIGIVAFLLVLATMDLVNGVSNDAANFLSSAVGAKAAPKKVIMIVASIGIIIGSVSSTGMMDIARHEMFSPSNFSFQDVMCIYLSVVIADVILLDTFNNLGMPTSTTVSMVFELFGAAFIASLIKINNGMTVEGGIGSLLNTNKAMTMIGAIFFSVAIAFVVGTIVMWITRLLFSFKVTSAGGLKLSLYSALASIAIIYFILIKGIGESPLLSESIRYFIANNVALILSVAAVAMFILMFVANKLGASVLKIVVLMGTFALALAFAGNDLVNFIGVTLAAFASLIDYLKNGLPNGIAPSDFMMVSLKDSFSASPLILGTAGAIMIFAMCFTTKAQKVLQRTILLAGRGDADTAGGSTGISRSIVRKFSAVHGAIEYIMPQKINNYIDKRFENTNTKSDSAFDLLRASVNLVLSGLLIALGTQYKLPLSTTYVAFTIAMGSALADRAWGRENAVYKLTGMFSVIGGWFVTAIGAFLLSSIICTINMLVGLPSMIAMVCIAISYMGYSFYSHSKNTKKKDHESELVETYLYGSNHKKNVAAIKEHVSISFGRKIQFISENYDIIFNAFAEQKLKPLRKSSDQIIENKANFKSRRKQFATGINLLPDEESLVMNAWFHLLANEISQMFSTLARIVEPLKEHTDNNFTPLPEEYYNEFKPISDKITRMIAETAQQIQTRDFSNNEPLSEEARLLKKVLSDLRKTQTDRLTSTNRSIQLEMIYLNLIIESHEMLSQMRNVLRGAVKFYGEDGSHSAN